MLRLVAVAAATLLAGCAPATPLALDGPAAPDAPAAFRVVDASALRPVPAPVPPAPLRPAAATAGAHGAASPAAHGAHAPAPATAGAASSTATPMGGALDAYLALHDALASDRTDAEAARQFATAFELLADAPPEDDPHFWHMRAAEVQAVRTAASALVDAADLPAARAAFGALSVPFAALVEAAGVPDGYALDRHVCGMADAPEGGVWLQREGPPRNPYFGTGMLMCSRGDARRPAAGQDHGAMDHGTMDHGAHGDSR